MCEQGKVIYKRIQCSYLSPDFESQSYGAARATAQAALGKVLKGPYSLPGNSVYFCTNLREGSISNLSTDKSTLKYIVDATVIEPSDSAVILLDALEVPLVS